MGHHLLHLHVDVLHFSIEAALFIKQGIQTGARIGLCIPRSYEIALERTMHRWAWSWSDTAFHRLALDPDHPFVVEQQVTNGLDNALADGYQAYWVVFYVPEVLQDESHWQEVEERMLRICRDAQVTMFCSFPFNDRAVLDQLPFLLRRHSSYYVGGKMRPLVELSLFGQLK